VQEQKAGKKAGARILRRLVPYVRRHALLGLGALGALVVVDAASVLQPYLIKLAIDTNIAARDLPGLARTGILIGIVMTAGFLFQVIFGYGIQYLGQKLIYDIRMDLFRKVLGLSNDYYDRTPVGSTLTNLSNDVEALREFIAEGIVSVAGDLLKVGFIIAVMLLINARLALISFVTIPFFIAATLAFRTRIRSGYREVRKANGEINIALAETISGIREIHQFSAEKESRESFEGHNRRYLAAYLKIVNAYALFFPSIEIVTNASMILILVFSHFAMGTALRVGEVFAFFAYVNMFFWPLRQLAEKFNLLQSAVAATERIFGLLNEKPSITDAQARPVPAAMARVATEPAAGKPSAGAGRRAAEVVLDRASFHYTPGAPVLRDITLRIRPGEKVAVVGPTGSGKTTLISLLARLYDVRSGRILLDGTDIRELGLDRLRKSVATVPQDVFLFTGTVAENISLYSPEVDGKTVEHAAAEVHANTFIAGLPRGYGEDVLEEGKRLSEGQRQLLGLARAFARDPSLVILDEATSSIDSETEHLIEDGIHRLLEGRTAIIIAHRLSTIRSVDRILVLHHGEIVQEGTHEELASRDGLYRQLYEMQSLLLER
jgi:ATP-binding cassette, subfamily B, multidrug efflux pump